MNLKTLSREQFEEYLKILNPEPRRKEELIFEYVSGKEFEPINKENGWITARQLISYFKDIEPELMKLSDLYTILWYIGKLDIKLVTDAPHKYCYEIKPGTTDIKYADKKVEGFHRNFQDKSDDIYTDYAYYPMRFHKSLIETLSKIDCSEEFFEIINSYKKDLNSKLIDDLKLRAKKEK